MEPLFINSTIYSKEELEKFFKFHRNKYLKKYILFTVAFVVYMLILIVFNLVNRNWKMAWGLIAIAAIIYIYYTQIREEKKQKNNKELIDKQFKFEFYDKYVAINNSKDQKLNYFSFCKIFETSTHFYMYVNKEYALMLNKEKFIKGNHTEFRNFIKKKCIFKYKKERGL